MGIILGSEQSFSDKPVVLDINQTPNPHIMVIGGTGAGKTTYLTKVLLSYLQDNSYNAHVIDLHGDLGVSGENYFEFTTRNSPLGINAFEFEKEEKNGGIYNHVEFLCSIFKKCFMPNLGGVQKSVLTEFLIDVYHRVGISEHDASTWDRPLPTIEDMKDFYEELILSLRSGQYRDFRHLFGDIEKLKNANKDMDGAALNMSEWPIEEVEKVKRMFEKVYEKVRRYEEHLSEGKHVEEFPTQLKGGIDISKYSSKQQMSALESLKPYFDSIFRSSIFNNNNPRPMRGINRYDIAGFTNSGDSMLAIFFADIMLQKIFRAAKLAGEYRGANGRRVHTYIVIDESKIILPTGKEKDNTMNIYNRLATEIRKYGYGLILISQRLTHFSDEILTSMFTKIILRTDSNDKRDIKKRLSIKHDDYMSRIDERGTAIVCMGQRQYLVNWSY